MEVEPMEQIGKIKQAILAQDNLPESRAVRHRRVLIDLVQEGGWLDERKFGLYVVGNYFRDLQGLASLLPLGLRMLATGKFPRGFEPSEGTEEVRSLMQAVRNPSWRAGG
jgi:succinate dehydrogenase / fumarate reductase iron-sulfur subunit